MLSKLWKIIIWQNKMVANKQLKKMNEWHKNRWELHLFLLFLL